MGTMKLVNTSNYIKFNNLIDSLNWIANRTKNSLFFEELWVNLTS